MEPGAPEVARLGMARLNAARLAPLGTLCRGGSRRISPIEPYIVEGQLLIGAMAWSAKKGDLRRDPRYVPHSVVPDPGSGEGNSSCMDRLLRPARTFAARRPAAGGWPGRRIRRSCSARVSCRRCSSYEIPGVA